MKIEKVTYLFLITIILIVGWKAYDFFNPNLEGKFNQNISKLNDRRKELDEIVRIATLEISRTNIPNNAMDLDDVSDQLKENMEDLGFRSFRFESINNCNKKYRFFFIAWEDWNTDNLNNVEIIYSPCNSETKKGFHSFDASHIDVFGAGGDWKILSDTDFM